MTPPERDEIERRLSEALTKLWIPMHQEGRVSGPHGPIARAYDDLRRLLEDIQDGKTGRE